MADARYDQHADWYDAYSRGDDHPTGCTICAAISELDDRRPGLLVDVGCGSAAHRRPLLQGGRRVVGADISVALLGYARRRLGAVAVSDGRWLPFANGLADAVNMTFVLSDVDDPSARRRRVRSVLSLEGAPLFGARPASIPKHALRAFEDALLRAEPALPNEASPPCHRRPAGPV